VVLVHEGIPIAHDPRAAAIYLSIVADAAVFWENGNGHRLIAVFPAESQSAVEALLARGNRT
jgi:hypothetical protein